MRFAWKVAEALADGDFQSGQTLAEHFGVSRTVIWRAVHALESTGLEIHSVKSRGYRLSAPVEWLDEDSIRRAVAEDAPLARRDLMVMSETDSTNQRMLEKRPPPIGEMRVCCADYQSGGRGRRGRRWLSPPGAGLYLSAAWLFERQPRQLTALGLGAGLAVRRALLANGVPEVGLKWPNDLTVGGRKLGGVLVELRAEGNGPAFVVVGVGVNCRIAPVMREGIEAGGGLPVTDLAEVCGDEMPGRNVLAGSIIGELGRLLRDYEADGFEPWRAEWESADALVGKFVRVEVGDGEMNGTARGIDPEGALLVETGSCLKRVIAGDVSVREQP